MRREMEDYVGCYPHKAHHIGPMDPCQGGPYSSIRVLVVQAPAYKYIRPNPRAMDADELLVCTPYGEPPSRFLPA